MRLVGASFAGRKGAETPDFDTLLADATRLLRGDGLDRVEAEAMRETLIQGYRWIMVDEYQDVGPEEYGLISAVAGRSIDDPDQRISLFAVGDDDQNIYAFAGASVRHIRQFEGDYSAKPVFLTDNYRSSQNIITAANAVIEGSRERMKTGHGITVDRSRRKERPGGVMERLDRVARGRVQILCCPSGNDAQALAALNEMIRLSGLVPDWSWKRAAIISRDRQKLLPVRGFAEAHGIPVEMANENLPGVWRKREMQAFIGALREGHGRMVTLGALTDILNAIPASRWTDRIGEGIGQLARETDGKALPSTDLIEWFAEWSRDTWGELRGLKLLTAHRAKGLEFDDVVILDGGWEKPSRNENEDAPRQLFFVAMTRARRNLIVMSNDNHEYLPTKSPAVVTRHVVADMSAMPGPRRFFQSREMKMVDLSYAGRQNHRHPVHNAISTARVGDPIRLTRMGDRWQIEDMRGRPLGRMARAFKPPANAQFTDGQIAAIIRWGKADADEAFHHVLHQDEWEVVVPELVFQLMSGR